MLTTAVQKLRKCDAHGYHACYTRGVNLLIISCHPYDRSFTRALAARAAESGEEAGFGVTRTDLYEEDFNPVLSGAELARRYSLDPPVQKFTEALMAADHLVFVHPDWWSGPPALLKGWIERVFRPGVAYDWVGEEFTEKEHTPLLTGRGATVIVTTDREPDDEPSAIRSFWTDLCEYSGLRLVSLEILASVRRSSFRKRREWLKQVADHISQLNTTPRSDS